MKNSRILMIAAATLFLVGCAPQNNNSSNNESQSEKSRVQESKQEKTVEYDKLSDAEREKVSASFSSKVSITKENSIDGNWPRASISGTFENKSDKRVKFEFDDIEIKDLNLESKKSGNLILEPGEKKTIDDLFTDLKNYDAAKGHDVKYDSDHLVLGRVGNLTNLKEYKEWIIEQKKAKAKANGQDVNTAATSGATVNSAATSGATSGATPNNE